MAWAKPALAVSKTFGSTVTSRRRYLAGLKDKDLAAAVPRDMLRYSSLTPFSHWRGYDGFLRTMHYAVGLGLRWLAGAGLWWWRRRQQRTAAVDYQHR